MTPAEQLLRKIAKVGIDDETRRALQGIIDQTVDWRELQQKAAEARIDAMVYHGLMEAGMSGSIPSELWNRFRLAYLANSIRNAVLMREANLMIKRLAHEGIPVIVLKGSALLASVYPNIAMRHMSDIDLLVRPEHGERADRVVHEAGFEIHDKGELNEEHVTEFVRPSPLPDMREGVWVEVHRGLVSQKTPFTFDIDALWERAVGVKIGDADAMALSVEDTIHHLAVHLFHHHFALAPEWRGLCDLGVILPTYGSGRIDWDYLLRSSQAYKTTGALFLALSALDDSLKTEELRAFLGAAYSVIQSMGMSSVVDDLSKQIRRHDYNTLSLLPSAVADIIQESSIKGKVRVARLYLNSIRRLIGSRGMEEASSTGRRPLHTWRSFSRLIKHNVNSIRLAYLIGKAAKQTRNQRRQEDTPKRNV